MVRGGEEREPHGLVALEVDLGGLEPGEPAEQVVELPLLDVGGEPRDEDGADLVGAGGSRRPRPRRRRLRRRRRARLGRPARGGGGTAAAGAAAPAAGGHCWWNGWIVPAIGAAAEGRGGGGARAQTLTLERERLGFGGFGEREGGSSARR